MTSEDGMGWLDEDEAQPEAPTAEDQRALAIATAGTSARLALFNVVRNAFVSLVDDEGLTRAELAKRLGVSRALVSRCLARPSNMTIETAARLMFGMGKELQVRERGKKHQTVTWNVLPSATYLALVGQHQGASGDACRVVPYQAHGLRMVHIEGTDDHDGIYEQIEAFNNTSLISVDWLSPGQIASKSSISMKSVEKCHA